ncbi:hypothetical protein [Bradyrhizobium canariense]|uniref:hypothetical protein n=1 Tax=Bradyrhizobium canariense TaxID=255045 RepID=UPI001B89FF12|nr:hypothetical protein [Bradyrhizobium canariense]MBR0954281.1 hypothetical protein [Bradyrhizobium canariense]
MSEDGIDENGNVVGVHFDYGLPPLPRSAYTRRPPPLSRQETFIVSEKGPNIKKKQKCKNCEGKGLLKKGDKVVKCQRCKGTGVR